VMRVSHSRTHTRERGLLHTLLYTHLISNLFFFYAQYMYSSERSFRSSFFSNELQ
jgi:hypothetical protein